MKSGLFALLMFSQLMFSQPAFSLETENVVAVPSSEPTVKKVTAASYLVEFMLSVESISAELANEVISFDERGVVLSPASTGDCQLAPVYQFVLFQGVLTKVSIAAMTETWGACDALIEKLKTEDVLVKYENWDQPELGPMVLRIKPK